MRSRLTLILFAGLSLVACERVRGHDVVDLERHLGWSDSTVTNTVVAERIRTAALVYQVLPPIPRVAFFDIAYPRDQAEYEAMNGYALVTITALAQDSTELPLGSAYLYGSDDRRDLLRIFTVSSRVAATDSVVAATASTASSSGTSSGTSAAPAISTSAIPIS